MTDITGRIAALPPDKQALLLQRLKQKGGREMEAFPAPRTPPDRWIIRYRQNAQASMRLFCFPYAGGGASVFRSWADFLPPEIEACCVQLPGHENRIGESAYTRLAPLVQALADAITPHLDRPFAFFGHSMGALVSFELTRELRRRREKLPLRLCLAAYRAPQLPNPNIKIYYLPTEVFKVVLRADGIPEQILQNEEFMQAMLPTLRADFELCDTYRHTQEPPLECPFSLFGGTEDVRVHVEDLEAWRIHSSAPSTFSLIPGSHLFLHYMQEPLVAAIVRDLALHQNRVAGDLAFASGRNQE